MVSKTIRTEIMPACNSTYPKGGVSCSKDSFVVNQTLVFQIKFCGKSPALRVAAKRYLPPPRHHTRKEIQQITSFNFQQNFIIFKHIAKGRNANNTFAKSLKDFFIQLCSCISTPNTLKNKTFLLTSPQ